MSIIARNYVSPWLVTIGYERSVEPVECEPNYVDLNIENTVQHKDLNVIVQNPNTSEGFIWDQKLVESAAVNSKYNTYLQAPVKTLENTQLEWWASGVNTDVKYMQIESMSDNGLSSWTPIVKTGEYSLHFQPRTLFSDYSFIQSVNPDSLTSGLPSVALRDDALWPSLEVAIWRRDTVGNIYKYRPFQFVDEFTGLINEDLEQAIVDMDDINPSELETRRYEYALLDNTLVLNQASAIQVGSDTDDACGIKRTWEYAPPGASTGRYIRTTFFPVTDLQIVKQVNDSTFTALTKVDSVALASSTLECYEVDLDLGIVQLSGFKAENGFLAIDITDTSEIITLVEDQALENWPEFGIVLIGTEKISFLGRSGNVLLNCERGYDATTATAHIVGSVVEHQSQGKAFSSAVYMRYTAIPRVEYEVAEATQRTATNAGYLDLKPEANIQTNNILQIQPAEVFVSELVLETDAPSLGSNLYGPVYYGNSFSRLTARALDPDGIGVINVPIIIEILNGQGELSSNGFIYTDISNSLGEIYSIFGAPFNRQTLEQIVSTVTHDGTDTVMTVAHLDPLISVNDVYVYQILKHDKTTGSVGTPFGVIDTGSALLPYGQSFIEVAGIVEMTYQNGFVYVLGSDSVRYYRPISWIEIVVDPTTNERTSKVYLTGTLNAEMSAADTIYLYEQDAIEWNASVKNGVHVILYTWDADALHPVTMLAGAFIPVRPSLIATNTLTFEDLLLPIPSPEDSAVNLGGYVVIAPGQARIRAKCRNPFNNQWLYSNVLRIDLRLPSSLTGGDDQQGQVIPYGWKLPTEEFNVASGIGGATFLTINPQASGINQFAFMGEINV